jgi:capsular exopolysaccharide synthesis family protein
MEANEYLLMMRRYWRVILAATLIGGLAAAALGLATRQEAVAQYSVTVSAVLLKPEAQATVEAQLLQSEQFVATTSLLAPLDGKGASRIATMTTVAESEVVLAKVASVLGTTIEDLQARLIAAVPPGTEILEISGRGPDEAAARALSVAVARQLTSELAEINPSAAAPTLLGTIVTAPKVGKESSPIDLEQETARLARALVAADPTAAQSTVTPLVAMFDESGAAKLLADLNLPGQPADVLKDFVVTAVAGAADPATGLIANTGEITIAVTASGAEDATALAQGAAKILQERATTAAGGDLTASSPLVITAVSDAALIPPSGSGDRTLTNVILGLLIGFAAGVGYAFFRASRDGTIRRPRQLFAITDTPPIGVVTMNQGDMTAPWVALNTSSPEADGYRSLRSNLVFGSPNVRVVAVTSPQLGDGKLTVAVNLAISLAKVGKSVALVETDLRQPRLANLLGLNPATGLAEVLATNLPIDQALQHWQTGAITVLSAGSLAPNAAELLSSPRYEQVLAGLRDTHDYVICLSGPILGGTEAAVVAKQSDGALVVVHLAKTTTTELAAAATTLIQVQASIAGLVVTAVPPAEAINWAVFPASAPAEV